MRFQSFKGLLGGIYRNGSAAFGRLDSAACWEFRDALVRRGGGLMGGKVGDLIFEQGPAKLGCWAHGMASD